jgi:hypothetical protein
MTAEQVPALSEYLALPSHRTGALAGTTVGQYEALAQRCKQFKVCV